MAKDKKSVVLYCDLIHTVSALSDDEAGKLFKHYLKYINDLNPEPPDRITGIIFEPIKQQLKRDLIAWESVKSGRVMAGHLGGIKSGQVRKQKKANEANASKTKQNEANEAVNVTVTVNDTVNVNDNVTVNNKLNKDYQLAVDFWLKDFKKGWTFSGMHGKALKSILKKLDSIAIGEEKDVYGLFVYLCKNLPEWYKDKDLNVLNSKFNEIVTEIKNKKHGNSTNKSKFS